MATTALEDLGGEVARLRKAAGLTVPALADKAELDRTHLWRFENRQARMSFEALGRLADALGVSLVVRFSGRPARRTRRAVLHNQDLR